jgi:hypothetical protein
VSSNQQLAPFQDADDSTIVIIGETVPGNLDYPGDIDFFSIWLSEGDAIEATVDTVNFDAFAMIAFPHAFDDEIAFDDDAGRGVFGTDAKVTYRAPHTGNYFIVVQDAEGFSGGGYLLSIAEAPPDVALSSPLPTNTSPVPVPTPGP